MQIAYFLLATLFIGGSSNPNPSTLPPTQNAQEYLTQIWEETTEILPSGLVEFWIPRSRLEIGNLSRGLSVEKLCLPETKLAKWSAQDFILVNRELIEIALQERDSGNAKGLCSSSEISELISRELIRLVGLRYNLKNQISSDDKFVAILGGAKSKFTSNKTRLLNRYQGRSPDKREFLDLNEAFASNLAFYLLDQEFPCRRPALSKYFDTLFDITRTQRCDEFKTVLVHSQNPYESFSRSARLSQDRVYQVHYLHVDKGPSFASRWGHSMFRLIICAPERSQKGPDCLQDTNEHLVLSYRASMNDLSPSYWNSLTGKYPSQLFVMSFTEIAREYTRMEFRAMKSIPLDFSQKELDNFLDLSLERYWSYGGPYYFLNNNCGNEALRHLEATLEEPIESLSASTPKKLLETLTQSKIANNKYQTLASKERLYLSTFRSLQSNGYFVDFKNLEALIKGSSSASRRVHYKELKGESKLEINAKEKRKLFSKIILLERFLNHFETKRILQKSLKRLIENDQIFARELEDNFQDLGLSPKPSLNASGYGIPRSEEVQAFASKFQNELSHKMKQLFELSQSNRNLWEATHQVGRMEDLQSTLLSEMLDSENGRSIK